ncbi:hypothetical protein [uncultured Brevundimonas sp.]|jgi:hypothetical protein|uniref:hypothetical protein n=1 Tax=uncultured Brevundimonas sp. TaxID=213418 RepID=UPI0030EC23EC|tara:strand:+ start:244 stop:432 length:189 start_codon:yes stop_codon:yes gene_type:complete
MVDPGPLRRGWSRLRTTWSRNDGKPREEWASGPDLKETVLIGALLVVVVLTGLATCSVMGSI